MSSSHVLLTFEPPSLVPCSHPSCLVCLVPGPSPLPPTCTLLHIVSGLLSPDSPTVSFPERRVNLHRRALLRWLKLCLNELPTASCTTPDSSPLLRKVDLLDTAQFLTCPILSMSSSHILSPLVFRRDSSWGPEGGLVTGSQSPASRRLRIGVFLTSDLTLSAPQYLIANLK